MVRKILMMTNNDTYTQSLPRAPQSRQNLTSTKANIYKWMFLLLLRKKLLDLSFCCLDLVHRRKNTFHIKEVTLRTSKDYFEIMDLEGWEIGFLPEMSPGSIPNIWPNSMFLSTKGEKLAYFVWLYIIETRER